MDRNELDLYDLAQDIEPETLYVATAPDGTVLQGVKSLTKYMVEHLAADGFTFKEYQS